MSYFSESFRKTCLGTGRFLGTLVACMSSPIYRATYHKNPSKVLELLAAGDDPNKPGLTGILPVQRASFSGHGETLSALLKGGADPDRMTDAMNIPAISLAAFNGRVEAVQLLLAYGADPLRQDGDGDRPMDYLRKSPCCSKDAADQIGNALSEAIHRKQPSTPIHSGNTPR